MPTANVSLARKRRSRPRPGVITQDEPSPLEHFFRRRILGQHPIPPDELTVRKGLRMFDTMEAVDETVAYAYGVKKMVRLSTGYSWEPPKDEEGNPLPGAEVIADHVTEQFERYGRFHEFIEKALGALKQGFRLAEIVTDRGKIGGRDSWVIRDLLVRNSRFFAFDVDHAGRIKRDGILEYVGSDPDTGGISSYWDPGVTERHPVDKFFRWTWSAEDDNAYSLYGRSDFRPIYRVWLLKDFMLKGWGETLETYKHPVIAAIHKGGLDTESKNDLLAGLSKLVKTKAAAFDENFFPQGEGVDYEAILRLHEVTGKAADFEACISTLDKQIQRGLYLSALISDTGKSGGGSLALGQAQMRVFLRVMEHIGRSFGIACRETLAKRIVLWNFGEQAMDLAPTLKMASAGDDEAAVRGKMIGELITMGVLDATEPWIRSYIAELPEAPPEIKEIRKAQLASKKKEAEAGPLDLAKIQAQKDIAAMRGGGQGPKDSPGGRPPGKAAGLAADDEPRARSGVESKVDVAGSLRRIESRERRYGRRLIKAWRDVFRSGQGGLAAQSRFAINNPDAQIVLRIDARAVEAVWRALYVEALVDGAGTGLEEINRGLGALSVQTLDEVEAPGEEEGGVLPAAGVPTLSLLDFARQHGVDLDARLRDLGERVRLRQSDLDAFAATRFAEIRTTVEGQVAKLRAQMQDRITQAQAAGVKPGAFLKGEFADLERRWTGIQADLSNENSGLYQTAEASVYTEGHLRLYEATPRTVVMGYLYSAVLDGATTAFCRAWDGFAAPRDDEAWHWLPPPNHWGCRSRIVAVLVGEMSEDELRRRAMQRSSLRPADGFRGIRWIPPVPGLN